VNLSLSNQESAEENPYFGGKRNCFGKKKTEEKQ